MHTGNYLVKDTKNPAISDRVLIVNYSIVGFMHWDSDHHRQLLLLRRKTGKA